MLVKNIVYQKKKKKKWGTVKNMSQIDFRNFARYTIKLIKK